MALWPNSLTFFGHFKTASVCARQIPKNRLKHSKGKCFWFSGQLHQECCNLSGGVALIVWFTTNGMCVKNNTIIYVARASNSKRDCEHDLYCCMLPRCEALRTCRSGFPIATVATAVCFTQSKPCFSMNWFNVSTMAWAVEQTPTLRQHKLTMIFVSWLANPQHKSTEPLLKYLLFHWAKYQTTELSSACHGVISTNLLQYVDIYV